MGPALPRGSARARRRPRDRRLHRAADQRGGAAARRLVGRRQVDHAGAAMRTASGRLCASRSGEHAHSSTVDPISQDVVAWETTIMWMLPHRAIYMDGRARPSPNAQHTLAGILDRRVGRRHAEGHHDAPQGRLAAPQRRAAQREGDARRVLHPARRISDAGHGGQRSGLSHRGVRAHVELGRRSRDFS